MTITTKELNGLQFSKNQNSLLLLPANFEQEEANYKYHSNTISFFKYANKKINLAYLTEPKELFEQRSGDWFSPVFLITQEFIKNYPTVTSIVCGIISTYIYEVFKGQPKPSVNVHLIYEKKETSKYIEFNYSGDVDGIESLQRFIDKALENKNEQI